MQITKNFWFQKSDNTAYKCIYMLYDSISSLEPKNLYELPFIEKSLEEMSKNESDYQRLGEGKG